jgi:amidase
VSDLRSVRVATVFTEGTDVLPLDGEVRAGLEAYASRLSDAGAPVEAVALPVPLADGLRSWHELVIPIMGTMLSDEVAEAFAGLESVPGDDPVVVAGRAMVGRYRNWAHADARRQHQRAAWASFFDNYDVVLAPVMPTAAFPHDTERPIIDRALDVDGRAVSHLAVTAWCGAIGSMLLPVVTLPIGRTAAGLPLGVQVIGPFLSDRRLLRLAGLLDAAAGPGFTPPPV